MTLTRSGSSRAGRTLVETVFLLLLIGVVLSRAAGPFQTARDRLAVYGAREAVIARVRMARVEALRSGSSRLVFQEEGHRISIWTGGESVGGRAVEGASLRLLREFGVELDLAGSSNEAVLRFDGMGLGRTVGRSVSLTRGRARTQLVISGYGRVRRL